METFFTKEEIVILLEIARVALVDATIFDEMANELDISDKEMIRIRDKLEACMQDINRDWILSMRKKWQAKK